MKLSLLIIFITIFCLQACKNRKLKEPAEILKEVAKADDINIGNLKFQFDLPQDWYRLDTVLQGVRLCILINNNNTYKPRINITNESMHGKTHSNYILGTKDYLTNNMTGIELLDDGEFNISGNDCLWYTYKKTQNGMVREMI